MLNRAPYSYLTDPNVPSISHDGPLTVMDGDCTLCSIGARLIARFDRKTEFRIARAQTPLGTALFRHYGLNPDDPESWLYIADGRAFTGMDAMIRAGRRVGSAGWLLQPLRLLPGTVQDWLYHRIARNRYRLFGRNKMCEIPSLALQKRLLEG